jgi:hypothetical protein
LTRENAQETDVTFALDDGKVVWYWRPERPDLTEQQAIIIGVNQIAGALENVAKALDNIAEAIRAHD